MSLANWLGIYAIDMPPSTDSRQQQDRREFESLLKTYKANAYEVVLIPKGTTSERASFQERQLGY